MTPEWIWIVLFLAAVAGGFLASKQARAAGSREAELEAAPLRERAEAAETRLESARFELQEALREQSRLTQMSSRIPELEGEVRKLRERAESLGSELREFERSNAELKTELRETKAREPEVRAALQRELAQFLDKEGKGLARYNVESLENILGPLRTKLQDFEKKVEDTQKDGHARHVELKTQITGLLGMNQRLSEEAQNLTLALKGENKTSGNWGELVLERVLEWSGLEKGREYDVQQAFTNEEGRRKFPDVVVYLPEKRQLVVDAKVSLVAYERYCSAESPEVAAQELQVHINSVRQHIRNLSEQRYQDLPGLTTPDFVFLFMPLEPAFIVAVKRDESLFEEAFRRNIVIVSPTTLLATLRTVANIWKQEKRTRNAEEIARLAGNLYDKFVGFLDDLQGIGDSLEKAQGRYEEARKKLKDGKGNLVGSVERIRLQGARAKKRIPAAWRDEGEPALEAAEEPEDAEDAKDDEESPQA